MFQFTISVGNFIVKLCYVLALIAVVIAGIATKCLAVGLVVF